MVYPLAVLGVLGFISAAAGAVDLSGTDWTKAALNFVLVTVTTFLVAILTEEGFFRAWLFASLRRAAEEPHRVLLWSSIAFSLWHLSAVALETGFDLPAARIPVYLVNVVFIGAIWGLLRMISGR